MRIRPLGHEGNNLPNPQFGAFLDCPLHVVELENGKRQGNGQFARGGDLFRKIKLDAPIMNRGDTSAPHHVADGDIEFLSHPRAQNPGKVVGVRMQNLVEACMRTKSSITPETLGWAQEFIKSYGTRA